MSSSSENVTISPESQVIVFNGNLLKAPPLNRRGRKKWHERYFLLRANKTIEIHKSRKAAESQKTPRRVIDLRECISLELGLEYKNLQHILSLGTFKRTFFLAAPSNALMLQWGNVLEKVKSATSGEAIEVLDIGLKNLRNCNPVHRVKPSEPLQPFLSTPISPKRIWGRLYQKGASKSSLAISSLGDIQQNGGPKNRGSGNVGYTSYYTSPNSRSSSLSNQEVNRQDLTSPTTMHGRLYGYPRMADSSIETVDLRDRGRLSGSSSNTSSSGPSPLHPPFSGGQIPPPHIMLKGWRANSSEKLTNHREGDSFYGGDDVQRDDRWRRANGKHGVRDGHLHRSEAFRSHGSRSRLGSASEGDSVSSWRARRASEDRGRQNDPVDNSLSFSPLKQSRNYRKIELQAEPALFGHRDEDEGSSDDERDSILSETTGKTSPGMLSTSSNAGKPLHMLGRDPHHHPPPLSIAARLELHGRRRNYSGPPVSGRRNGSYGYLSAQSREKLEMGGRDYLGGSGGSGWGGSTPGHGNTSPFGDEVGRYSPRRPNFLSRYPPTTSEVSAQKFYSLESLERSLKEERANGYCKLTIGERDDDALSRITSSRTGISSTKLDEILSKSSVNSLDYDIELPSPTPSSIHEDETGQRVDISGQDVSESLDTDIQLSPPSSPNFDDTNKDFRLPTRDSNSFLYRSSGSAKSPIEDIIAPPLNFDVDHATSSCLVNETISEEAELPTCVNLTRNDDDKPSSTITDRNSTESSDTGYTSGQGQSPGISERKMLTTVEEFTPVLMAAEPGDLPGQCAQGFPYSTQQDALFEGSASSIKNSQSTYSMRSSQISYASTDSIRLYVPMVFHKSAGRRESSKRSLVVVVCLVENSDSLIKELLSQKVAGGYRVVECEEEEEGRSVVSGGDDFTVETALEDLEFGFSVITSTQKDVYINRAKVREFQFQIDNLFGSWRKPFSCDVEIRHADQITVLPIEIECAE